tara:strand:- start:725 stop:1882 length:1158 start_codon:yes stop_codon:yes gene_type:complete
MEYLAPIQRTKTLFCTALLGLVISSPSAAQQGTDTALVVSGQALVTKGDNDTALMMAILDALRTAATQRKGQIISHSMVDAQGQLTENISLQSDLKIHHMDLLEQNTEQGIATVKLALNLEDNEKDCPLPQLTQVLTTDLASPPGNNNYHQVDVNQLLLDTEAQFSKLAKRDNFATHRINSALNAYQTAWLASEAYDQADYHLAIGAQWLEKNIDTPKHNAFSTLSSFFDNQNSATLLLTANFSSPYLPHINLNHQHQFPLSVDQSIASSSNPIPPELSKSVAIWVQKTWHNLVQNVRCEASYIKLTKIVDQPLWRINKGQKLGLEQGQQLLLLPQNYQNGILNPNATSAPQVFRVTQVQPHTAILEHMAGPTNIGPTTAQLIVF